MEVQIEEMLEDHLNNLNLDEFDDFWNINILKQELKSENSIYIVAKYDNEIIGFAGINLILDEAHIANIAVRKDKRGLGIRIKTFGMFNK
ncbi:MAG: GNAT family N-acetyltransferase [Clostridia bacterium]|nr:GNAT family N-acetyltransferase [Clostridia bacterium]